MKEQEKDAVYNAILVLANAIENGQIEGVYDRVRDILTNLLLKPHNNGEDTCNECLAIKENA